MTRYNHHQSSFKNGMLSKKLLGRTDIEEYASGAKEMHNFLPDQMGGTFSRCGTVNQMKLTSQGIFIPWETSSGVSYIIYRQKLHGLYSAVFEAIESDFTIRTCIFSLDQLQSYGTTTDMPTHEALITAQTNTLANFDTLDYYGFSYVNIGNNLVLTHSSGLIPPLVFYRLSSGAIRIEHYQFSGKLAVSHTSGLFYGSTETALPYKCTPYLINETSATLNSSVAVPVGQEGLQTTAYVATTLTASANYFTSNMLHTYVIINQADKEGVYWITSVASTTSATAVVIHYGSGNTATVRHRRQLFAPDLGFPKVISIFNNRLLFANTYTKPNWLWASRTNAYKEIYGFQLFQFKTSDPVTSINSFELPLTSRNYSEIKWISQMGDLIIGTGREEFVIKQGSDALSILNIGISPQSSIGGSLIPAVKSSEAVYFVAADGKSIRQIQYNFEVNGFRSKNISILNDDMIYKLRSGQSNNLKATAKIVKLVWNESSRILWALTNTNNLFSITIEQNSATVAWAYHTIGSNDDVVDINTFFSTSLSKNILSMVCYRLGFGYYVNFLVPEYLGTDLDTTSANISDIPVFMDNCVLITTQSVALNFSCEDYRAPNSYLVPHPSTSSFFGLPQAIPTGKKFAISELTYPNADGPMAGIDTATHVYLINNYNGYKNNTVFWYALTLADALAGIPFVSTKLVRFTLTDDEPLAKYTKWGTFADYIGSYLDVIADGILYEGLQVDNFGMINLPVAASKIVAGLRFEGTVETVTPDVKGNLGSNIGSVNRVDRAFVRYYNSRTAKIGSKLSNLNTVAFPAVPFTGTIDHAINSSTDREWSLIIKKEQSLPLNVMCVTLRGNTNE